MGKQSAVIAARFLYPMIGPEPRRGTLSLCLSAWDLDSFMRSVWCPVDWPRITAHWSLRFTSLNSCVSPYRQRTPV